MYEEHEGAKGGEYCRASFLLISIQSLYLSVKASISILLRFRTTLITYSHVIHLWLGSIWFSFLSRRRVNCKRNGKMSNKTPRKKERERLREINSEYTLIGRQIIIIADNLQAISSDCVLNGDNRISLAYVKMR